MTRMKTDNIKAQSTFEYILLMAGVVVVLIIFLNPNGPFRNTVEKSLSNTVDQLNGMVSSFNFN